MNPKREMNICLGWCIFALVNCVWMLATGKSGWASIQAFYTFWFAAHALWWAKRL